MRMGGLAASLACVLVVGTASAQDVKPDYSADEFVKAILKGPQPCPKGMTQEACEANPKTRRFTRATPDTRRPRRPAPAGPAGPAAARPPRAGAAERAATADERARRAEEAVVGRCAGDLRLGL